MLNSQNIVNGTTDHNIIELMIKLKGKINTPVEVQRRSLKNWDLERYKEKIKNINWTKLYQQSDISLAYNVFETEILEHSGQRSSNDNSASQDKVIKTGSLLKQRIKLKSEIQLREKARLSSEATDWRNYRKQRNLCTASLRKR